MLGVSGPDYLFDPLQQLLPSSTKYYDLIDFSSGLCKLNTVQDCVPTVLLYCRSLWKGKEVAMLQDGRRVLILSQYFLFNPTYLN